VVARHYYQDDAGNMVEVLTVLRQGWEVREAAEEGESPIISISVDDPNMNLDFVGHRRWLVLEDESTDTDDVLYCGYTGAQTISRSGDELHEPLGRVWTIEINDVNTLWGRRVMVGSDCKRPAETDVQRMQWLLSTGEAGEFDDVTTYVSTASPVNMDAVDYRGQMFDSVAEDCAHAGGKNWYAWLRNDGAAYLLTAWYGKDSVAAHVSSLSLSNDRADWVENELEDGTSLVWPIGAKTELKRDPGRQYSGNYLAYEKGAVFRTNPALWSTFKRDFISPISNVKTQPKAAARATRQLTDLATQDHRITTSVEVPKEIATKIRTGMRIRFKGTHLPDYSAEFQWSRVLNCTPKPVAAGSRYELGLELSKSTGDAPGPWTGSAFAALLVATNDAGDIDFTNTGDSPPDGWYGEPTVGPMTASVTGHGSITIGAPMTVRIQAAAAFTGVQAGAGAVGTMTVRVNGSVIDTQSAISTGGGMTNYGAMLGSDLHDIALEAGDVVDVEGSLSGNWAGFQQWRPPVGSVNTTFLRVGRGTQVWDTGSVIWVGP
jgi:hypothetical protein